MKNLKNYDFKITPKELIHKIIELYKEARELKYKHPKIRRGENRSISDLTEDLFAFFLTNNLVGDYDFLIDQPITVDLGKKLTFKPDITIIQNKKVRDIIDLKMDLGRVRDKFPTNCNKQNEIINKIKGKIGNYKDETTKKLEFSADLTYHIVLISETNIPPKMLKDLFEEIKRINLKFIQIYVLTSKQILNDSNKSIDEILERTDIHNEEFVRLMENLTK